MYSCTFIGHHNAPETIKPYLKSQIINLIKNQNVNTFYFGTHGNFDFMVKKTLTALQRDYPQINIHEVFAYLPPKDEFCDYTNTIYPDIEKVPLKYAITERNKWMIKNSDYLICYVTNTTTNSYNFLYFARKKNKKIINLFDML